jgi:hypothetical protein
MEIAYTHRGAQHRIVVVGDQVRVTVDGRVVRTLVTITGTEADATPSLLDQLATESGVWGGPATRAELHALAERMLPARPKARDYARVIEAFQVEGRRRMAAELGRKGGAAGKGRRQDDCRRAAQIRWVRYRQAQASSEK